MLCCLYNSTSFLLCQYVYGCFMSNLSVHLKKVRLEHNYTQRQVADGIGIAEQAYQRYEYGRTVPSALVLIALADFFNVSLDYLVGRSDDPTRH